MKTCPWSHLSRVAVLGLVLLIVPLEVQALTATAGWTRSDVGLHDKGDGVYLGVNQPFGWDNPVFDASYGLEYVQKKGSQPTPFSDPLAGLVVDDAAVTLHVVQPSVFFGARLPGHSVVPRLYVGGSIGLKVKESWSDFPGTPDKRYGYKETDAIIHLGASLGVQAFTLDVRWSRSMVGQLLKDPREVPLASVDKATDVLAGVRIPEIGHDTEVVRVGVAVSF